MPGARCTRSLACKSKKAHEVVTTGSPEQPGIPRAMVLTVSFVISPVIGLVCHRRRRNHFRQLDASVEAPGPHDFAVRVSTFRQACYRVHRIPCPTFVTIAKRPFVWDGMARVLKLIWGNGEAEYFSGKDWTTQITLIAHENFAPARNGPHGPTGRLFSRMGAGAGSAAQRPRSAAPPPPHDGCGPVAAQ